MRITIKYPLKIKTKEVVSPYGNCYDSRSLLLAIKEFNSKCPRFGCMMNKKGTNDKKTHHVYKLWMESDSIAADIELLDNSFIFDDIEMRLVFDPINTASGLIFINRIARVNISLKS